MIKVTLFGAHDGCLNFDTQIYLTLFGACEVTRPTLARQLLALRQAERCESTDNENRPNRLNGEARFRHRPPLRGKPFFFTMFASAEIQSPTLAEEFVDLREAMDSGAITPADCDRLFAGAGLTDTSVGSITLFGAFEEGKAPPEDKEVDGLAIQRHLGNVSEQAGRILALGIGQSDGQRRAVLRQAVLAET
ncbi:MAG: hypothetical protein ACE5HE_04355 [Phycisphaerae bacterium]